MSKARALVMAIILAGALALPLRAFAQAGYTGARSGPNNLLQNLETVGPNAKPGQADDELIKDAKRRFADADPRVRVEGLEKLRYVAKRDRLHRNPQSWPERCGRAGADRRQACRCHGALQQRVPGDLPDPGSPTTARR